MDILLATGNTGKLREVREMMKHLDTLHWHTFRDFPDYTPPEETGATLLENATLKAVHAAKNLGIWSLADDSGLFVPALNGDPGVYSARYAGAGSSDAENRSKLLKSMASLPEEQRAAYFECTLVLANPAGEVLHTVSGRCEGEILDEERGSNGFGYDPLFLKGDYGKTFGELDASLKNGISHRAKAVEKMMLFLEKLPRN